MAAIELGQGGRLDPFTLTPFFPGGSGSTRLAIPDPLFPEIKGTVKYSTGSNATATAVGQTAMGVKASGKLFGTNFSIGFKQVALFKFHTAFFIGIKDADGCIEDTSTGLNFRSFLDCSPNSDLRSPWAPFYLPRKVAGSGVEFNLEMPDQPAGSVRLQRRNSKRDRLNFLVSFATECEFLTFFTVERPDGVHVPVRGLRWSSQCKFDVSWSKGNPTVHPLAGGATFLGKVDSLPAGDSNLAILTDTKLTDADTIVTKFFTGSTRANRGAASPDYAVAEFENYTGNITPAMQSRVAGMV